jgi:hypothetical protein
LPAQICFRWESTTAKMLLSRITANVNEILPRALQPRRVKANLRPGFELLFGRGLTPVVGQGPSSKQCRGDIWLTAKRKR